MAEQRPDMPSLGRIAEHWSNRDDFADMFPHAKILAIGWGEPSCLRCGWMAPVRDALDYSEKWACERRLRAAWNGAAGWLERCHLHDHSHGGSSNVDNLVPLCPVCHREQKESEAAEDGIAFVNSLSVRRTALAPLVQAYTDSHYEGRRLTGRGDAERLLERAYAEVGTLVIYFKGGWQ